MRTIFILLGIAGCFGDPDYSGLLCDNGENQCPGGYDCVGGHCARRGSEPALPAIVILEPADGTTLDGAFDLTVNIENLEVSDAFDSDPVPGQGHYHLFIDGTYDDAYAEATIAVDALDPGCRTLRVELVQNDHISFDPPAEDAVGVYASDGGPTICIESPAAGEILTTNDFNLQVDIQNFVLDDSPAENHGHWHLWVDNVLTDAHFLSQSETVSIEGSGEHDIMVELVRADESSLASPRTATVTVTVQ